MDLSEWPANFQPKVFKPATAAFASETLLQVPEQHQQLPFKQRAVVASAFLASSDPQSPMACATHANPTTTPRTRTTASSNCIQGGLDGASFFDFAKQSNVNANPAIGTIRFLKTSFAEASEDDEANGKNAGSEEEPLTQLHLKFLKGDREKTSFEEAAAEEEADGKEAGGEEGKEDVEACYAKEGHLCNKDQVGIDPHKLAELDAQNDALRLYVAGGFCNDPKFEKEEECVKEGGEWHELEGPTLWDQLHTAEKLAKVKKEHVESAASDYEKAFNALTEAFNHFKKEVVVWQQAISGIENDYALHCRPFHDVTMECEAKFRRAMRWWFAREPLPSCEIGVITPYLRNKRGGFSSFLATG